MQTRICFCGQELLPGEDPCPNCGADWQGGVKVRRRKRRKTVNALDLLRYAAVGIFIALVLASILNSVIGGLALKSAESTNLPPDYAERLGLAWQTVSNTFEAMSYAFLERLGGTAPFVLMGIIGAMVGVLYYLRREGALGAGARTPHGADANRRHRR